MRLFRRDNQTDIMVSYLPLGRVYRRAFGDSNFRKVIQWLGVTTLPIIDTLNDTLKGLFPCRSTYMLDRFKGDYGIPNGIFYQTDEKEHQADIVVMKHLMRGNTLWHFKAIANMYGIDANVYTGEEWFDSDTLPAKLPFKLASGDRVNTIVVMLFGETEGKLPYKLPFTLNRENRKYKKLREIYEEIKPAHTKVVFVKPRCNTEIKFVTDKLPLKLPFRLGGQEIRETTCEDIAPTEDREVCTEIEREVTRKLPRELPFYLGKDIMVERECETIKGQPRIDFCKEKK